MITERGRLLKGAMTSIKVSNTMLGSTTDGDEVVRGSKQG